MRSFASLRTTAMGDGSCVRNYVPKLHGLYTSDDPTMRTNIQIDHELLTCAMKAAGLTTKKATVEEGLRLLLRVSKQAKALADIKGLGWQGDLDQVRRPRQSGTRRSWSIARRPVQKTRA